MAGRRGRIKKPMGVVEVAFKKYGRALSQLFCPVCGSVGDFSIDLREDEESGQKVAIARCSKCGFRHELRLPAIADKLYAFGKLVDEVWYRK